MLELPFATIKRESLSVVVIVTMMMVMAIVAMIIVVVSFSGTIQTDHAKQSERCVLQNFHLFLSPQIISCTSNLRRGFYVVKNDTVRLQV